MADIIESEFFAPAIVTQAHKLVAACAQKSWKLVTAESCTGGLMGGLFTEIAGASRVYGFGYVTYSNAAKHHVLGVPKDILQTHGAVSNATVLAMAQGAKRLARAQLACAISGIAGPDGGQVDKPVGTVHIAIIADGKPPHAERFVFDGTRSEVRAATLAAALPLMLARL